MDVGIRIRDYLTSQGIKQTWLSKTTGIPLPKLNLSLNGKRRLTFEDYQTICFALKVDVGTFLKANHPRRRQAAMNDDILSYFSTRELVEELEYREGVETQTAKPYQDLAIKVNGPAIVLVVTD